MRKTLLRMGLAAIAAGALALSGCANLAGGDDFIFVIPYSCEPDKTPPKGESVCCDCDPGTDVCKKCNEKGKCEPLDEDEVCE